MVLPNFLIVGAMKAGTSWLAYNLGQHPEVFMPKEELHFFNDKENFAKGRSWYEKQFEPGIGKKAVGEKTAGYLLCRTEPSFIKEYLPDVKIIAVLRDPVTRAVSQINHHIRYGDVSPFLKTDGLIDSPEFAEIDQKFALLERGDYFHQVKAFYDCFGAERCMVIVNETDIRKQPEETLRKVCEFLGVDPTFNFDSKEKKIHQNTNTKLGVALSYRLPLLKRVIAKVDRVLPGPKVTPFRLSESDAHKLYKRYEENNAKLFQFLDREMPTSWAPKNQHSVNS